MKFKKVISPLFFLIITICMQIPAGLLAQALTPEQLAYIKKSINTLIKSVDPHVHVGIEVISLKNNERLYAFHEHHLFVPASTLKLFTTSAALWYLGYDHKLTTQLLADGDIKKKKLHGNLYLKAAGDPSLKLEDLEALLLKLKEAGITKITGNLYIDASIFDETPLGPGWMWCDGAEFWNSPVSALVINHNCVKITVAPGNSQVTLYPDTDYVDIQNKLDKQGTEKLKVQRRWKTKENIIDITGTALTTGEPQEFLIPIENPLGYAATLIRDLLKKHHIQLLGNIEQGKTPACVSVIAEHQSAPLIDLVATTLQESDNLYAECLLKVIGHAYSGEAGSYQNGNDAVRAFVQKNNMFPNQRLEKHDGSGVSRYNLLSPHQIIELLVWERYQENFLKFLKALPQSGVNGTLKARMLTTAAYRKVWAKTGNMKGNSALAGYIATKDKEPLAFAIMFNNYVRPAADYKNLEDKICEFFASFSRNNKQLS